MKNKGVFLILLLVGFVVTSFKVANFSANKSINKTADEDKGFVVLELYTSQGCSSCPPADALLEKVKNQYAETVIPLSYHVDYWNYIGWDDPFSKATYTEKQTAYNYKFKNRSNYTPQVVVNGATHFVGSNSLEMYKNINIFKNNKPDNTILVSNVKTNANSIKFEYSLKGELAHKKIRVVLILDKRVTKVKGGENRNRVLTNNNIVVAEKYIVANASGEANIQIPEIVKANEKIALLLISENEQLDITGATKINVSR
ncbi:DUF1223 domain-containing protein [Cellulophaga baltica]|uniref:DUF1223 domain-containing protein n=1 Tax=Cellulophaga TaxID=104264 RepID=UPI001C06E531|nr:MULTISPECIES: DUF1223 domain-containing protein [Cellulophaga]MBU2996709.1 DUF1223 domain-containing protein [Cellulophaga baltica]MDO6768103.1 DUF1223 domain-containing protein [Cellulophaga sp. 1_MG-2023]